MAPTSIKRSNLADAKLKRGVYIVDNVKDLMNAFDEDHRLKDFMIPSHWVTHLKTNYRDSPGVTHLGYTVKKPIIVVKPKNPDRSRNEQKPGCELLVVCEQGNLSREEANGEEYMPTELEVQERAAEIRAKHMEDGVVRNGDFVGFSLQKVINRPKISLA